jgi:hypothetical protein
MGSDLAQPTNDLETNTLTNVLAASSTDPNDSFWIGKTVSPSFVLFGFTLKFIPLHNTVVSTLYICKNI